VNNTYSSTRAISGYAAFPLTVAAVTTPIALQPLLPLPRPPRATFSLTATATAIKRRHPLHHVQLTSRVSKPLPTPPTIRVALVAERSGRSGAPGSSLRESNRHLSPDAVRRGSSISSAASWMRAIFIDDGQSPSAARDPVSWVCDKSAVVRVAVPWGGSRLFQPRDTLTVVLPRGDLHAAARRRVFSAHCQRALLNRSSSKDGSPFSATGTTAMPRSMLSRKARSKKRATTSPTMFQLYVCFLAVISRQGRHAPASEADWTNAPLTDALLQGQADA